MSDPENVKKPDEAPGPKPSPPVETPKADSSQLAELPAPGGSESEAAKLEPGQTPSLASSTPRVSEPDVDELARWNDQVLRRMRRQTRRSFVLGGAAALVGWTGWRWLQTRREDGGIAWPLRRALDTNEELARDYFSTKHLAPDFGGKAPIEDRVNGDIGLEMPVDAVTWRLRVEGLANHDAPVELTLNALRKLPTVEMTTEFKCIEGWSAIMQWAGLRFSDFMKAYPPATQSGDPLDIESSPEDLPGYVGMATPGGGYYVGLDMETMLHPQTLLAYDINGGPLPDEHGAPLRLVTPVKYGVKNIKRIGTIHFSRNRPGDYWAEQGYDWYAGL
jgi:molybdopterin-dependent oxidoreductase-like protein protein